MNNYKGHMDNNKGGVEMWEGGRAGSMVGRYGGKLYLNNNKKIKILKIKEKQKELMDRDNSVVIGRVREMGRGGRGYDGMGKW